MKKLFLIKKKKLMPPNNIIYIIFHYKLMPPKHTARHIINSVNEMMVRIKNEN